MALRRVTLVVFLFNALLFILFTAMSLARYLLFPGIWKLMMHHPVQSLYVGERLLCFVDINVICVKARCQWGQPLC